MPVNEGPNRRLADLLEDPRESLDVELKGWLDIRDDKEHKATLAKAIVAQANNGGGVVIIGLEEVADGAVVEARERPSNMAGYTPDTVNAVVNRYVEPTFHCDVQIVKSPRTGADYPIIAVPGGHTVPIRSKRGGPDGKSLQANVYYIRRPGPQSEQPQSGREWDELMRRCLANAREGLLDQFRMLMAGGPPVIQQQETEERALVRWWATSLDRWADLAEPLPKDHPARLRHGRYAFAYQMFSDALEPKSGAGLLEALRAAVVRHTGWPPFWVPTRDGIAPYMRDGNVECWLGPDGEDRDPGHADFWRASPDAQLFLLRGYQEDGSENERAVPGKIFDLTLPVWRVGEVLLHAESMARQFGVPGARVEIIAEWTGLEGRTLTSWANPDRWLVERNRSREATCFTSLAVQADQISDALPELVDRMVRPLFELFDFFELPPGLVADELARMRARRF
jgi:transcriptional regulator with XRE-family HTH domain